ncbi:uncharacterized protein TNCV_1145231 [Trichonephila clavipes]|nr:uncharacterized protein TNCV_1145231 [Trichonephila clavipes]
MAPNVGFNLYDHEMRNGREFNVWPKVYFSGSEKVTELLEGIDNQIKLPEIPSDLSCAYLKCHLLGRGDDIFGYTLYSDIVQNIRIDVSAKYRHGLHTAESNIVESIPGHPK